jgi:hypothetical protein
LLGWLPLRRIGLGLAEEELPEGEVRARDELRRGGLRDEVEVDAARVGGVARLLVFVREVVEDLVEKRVGRKIACCWAAARGLVFASWARTMPAVVI